ncbi:hypothetical protein BU23DRAFT_101088 [Bimuria novae-zelandiae CBS 107.79]|uniref:Uncharacterized protein n=1 Tax=Bimuria novae-zelandiae CBS 107.79 TaxID=1447943 RepID=A0A6A5VS33_9PLEO|nr:hypothetical protein BU23DRAFT_101088 [Bimuria novae-zelandiae CBS 107.79]
MNTLQYSGPILNYSTVYFLEVGLTFTIVLKYEDITAVCQNSSVIETRPRAFPPLRCVWPSLPLVKRTARYEPCVTVAPIACAPRDSRSTHSRQHYLQLHRFNAVGISREYIGKG